MRRFFALLAVGAMFTIAEPAQAQSEDPHSIGTFCLAFGDQEFDTQGECASFIATLGLAWCTEDIGGVPAWEDEGFKNQGECVSYLTRLIREAIKEGGGL